MNKPARRGDRAAAVLTLDTFPDLAALHAANPAAYPHLLESAVRGTPRARYDILFAHPRETLTLTTRGLERDGRLLAGASGFLDALNQAWQRERLADAAPAELPFTGGWFVYLGYELVAEIEPSVRPPRAAGDLPIAAATRFPAAVIRDHAARCTHLVAEAGAEQLLETMRADLASFPGAPSAALALAGITEDDPARFLRGVDQVREYIAAGDVFQVNLSRGWRAPLAGPIAAADLYQRLRTANPAPFAGLSTLPGGAAVISSSPERLVSVRDGVIRTRPIAGTYPRGKNADEDNRLARELLQHPKERAEHVMLIDLERNDLGRVCRPGTVLVPELMVIETYQHVHHIVSEVKGELRADATPADVIRAVFPGGTITGCPKVRCMQIIAELEEEGRGAYTGSMGYINRDGSMDLNILIRTLVLDGRTVHLRAGAGIVADSIPERELSETRAKARGLLAALGAA